MEIGKGASVPVYHHQRKEDIDEGTRQYSLTNRTLSMVNSRWEFSARLAFDHIRVKKDEYNSEFVDHYFEQVQLCYTASKSLCTLFEIEFVLPELEASEFRKAALRNDMSYLQRKRTE